MTFEMYSTFW